MKIKNATGEHKRLQGEQTRKTIYEWFLNNPDGNKKQCARALGLSYPTVLFHVRAIEQGDFVFDTETGVVLHVDDCNKG